MGIREGYVAVGSGATAAGGTQSDDAVITSASATPLTATETTSASDGATRTSAAASPITATETATASDAATRTTAAATPLTATSSGVASDAAALTTVAASPITAAETATASDAATLTTATATVLTSTEFTGTQADILAPATVTVAWDDSATHKLTWDDSATVMVTMADNIITQETVPAVGENIERTIEVDEDGSDKDISGATVEWYLVPSEDSADTDSAIDQNTTGVDLSISNASAGEITLSVDQGVTDGLSGRWWQRLKVDDTGDGLQVWGGVFKIDQA